MELWTVIFTLFINIFVGMTMFTGGDEYKIGILNSIGVILIISKIEVLPKSFKMHFIPAAIVIECFLCVFFFETSQSVIWPVVEFKTRNSIEFFFGDGTFIKEFGIENLKTAVLNTGSIITIYMHILSANINVVQVIIGIIRIIRNNGYDNSSVRALENVIFYRHLFIYDHD